MDKPVLADVVELTKNIVRGYINGNPDPWFDSLSQNFVFVSDTENIIIGADNIRQFFFFFCKRGRGMLYRVNYSRFSLSSKIAIVVANIVTDTQNNKDIRVSSCYTFVYQLIGKDTKLVFEHTSYTFFQEQDNIPDNAPLAMDTNTLSFVKQLLMEHSFYEKICVISNGQTLYIDPKSLIYIKANNTGTELYCIDRVISCSKKLYEIKSMLKDYFYQIHRSYIINIHYLVSIKCYEARLISGITLSIPSANYGKIKKDLEERIKMID